MFKFNKHYDLVDKHAFLGASKPYWLNYSEEKLREQFRVSMATERGTRLHKIAKELIDEKIRLPRNKQTLSMYVNDAIGWNMATEQPIFYSNYAFGTADSIQLDDKKGVLRIHDLKTGVKTQPHMEQLLIYAAYFCLEYGIDPEDIEIIMRLYWRDEVIEDSPPPEHIRDVMEKTKRNNDILIEEAEGMNFG